MEVRNDSAASHATPGPLPVPRSTTRRWQFSLKTLFVVTTLAAVAAAWAVNPMPFLVAIVAASRILPFALIVILCQVIFATRPLRLRSAAVAIVAGATLSLLVPHRGGPATSICGILWRVVHSGDWAAYALLSCWFLAWLMWRVLARTPRDFTVGQTRRAAIATLVVVLAPLDAILFVSGLSTGAVRIVGPDVAPRCLAIVGGVAAILPWIKLLRGHSRRLNPGYGRADTVSKVLLASSIGVAALSWVTMAAFFACRTTTPPATLGECLGLMIYDHMATAIPLWIQCGATGLFVAGFLLEVYRDRWHPRLTAIGGLHLGWYWVTAFLWPELFFKV
jgi:hypothetical protein